MLLGLLPSNKAFYRLEPGDNAERIEVSSVIKGNPVLFTLDCAQRLVKPSTSRSFFFAGRKRAAPVSFIAAVEESQLGDCLLIGQSDGELWLWAMWRDELTSLPETPHLVWASMWPGSRLATVSRSGRLTISELSENAKDRTAFDLLEGPEEGGVRLVRCLPLGDGNSLLAVASESHLTLWLCAASLQDSAPPVELSRMALEEPLVGLEMARGALSLPVALRFASHLEWLCLDLTADSLPPLYPPLMLDSSGFNAMAVHAGNAAI